jgi:uncharacterized protein YbaR (Trm112 family)/trans-aconitate methyltransferase
MKRDLMDLLCCPDCHYELALHDDTPEMPEVESGTLVCDECNESFPIVRGVPRFVTSDHYTGSFSYEWNRWNRVQLDIANGGTESERTFAAKTGFTPDDLRGKLVLDVGCGAGRFLDVASRWGARVVGVDLSFAVEASHRNLGSRPNVVVIQADVFRLPFRPKSFEAIFSLGVLHHSRDTREAFLRLPPLLADDGSIAIWLYHYTDRLYCLASDVWRALLRPLPARAIYVWSWLLVTLFSRFSRLRVLPLSTHPDRTWRILDTFDWYSPRYQDKNCSPARVIDWCREAGIRDVRVLPFPTSIHGIRRRAAPLVRYTVPDVRFSRVLVFGAGTDGHRVVPFVNRIAPGRIVGVVDNDPAKEGTDFHGFTVTRFDRVPDNAYDLIVIACAPGVEAITEQLRAAGLFAGEDFIHSGELDGWFRLAAEYEGLVRLMPDTTEAA